MGQGQGREQLPFDIGQKFESLSNKSIWSVHSGRRKAGGEPVTVFVFDYTNKSPDEVKLAQAAHLRLKTLRHPNVLRYIDGIELPTCIYVVTEEATPLEDHMTTEEGHSDFSTAWGLHQIIKAVSFLSADCGLVHRNVCLSSVFVDQASEWKLAGVEFMHPHGDIANTPRKFLEALRMYDPPEASKSGGARRGEKWSTDMWGIGCLIWEVFNGPLSQPSSLRNTAKIPKSLISHYCECVSANPKSRPNPSNLLSSLREHGGFLSNQFVSIALKIEEVQIMEPSQRNQFFTELNKHLDSFPERFAKHKILPHLLNAFEFGGAGSAVLAPLFRLGALLEDSDYQKKIVPCVVKLFSSNDRATRLNLLQQLDQFIDHLQPSTVNDQIFPHVASGFTDTVPALREQTVKSMVLITPKLSESTRNTQLLKYLAKCQMDEQPGIRTNTNVCLGKISRFLSPSTRQKVLVSAFLRALKDPFPPARSAAITAMASTHAYYTTTDLATRLLPALCALTVDKEKNVREQVFQTIKLFVGKLEKISDDPEAAAQQKKEEAEVTSSASWTGWAVSSITSKFYKSPSTATTTPTVPPSSATSSGSDGAKKAGDGVKGEGGGGVRGEGSGGVRDVRDVGRKEEEEPIVREESQTLTQNEGWGDDSWEDFPASSEDKVAEGGDGSDMEGWEDDGWASLESPPPQSASEKPPSSGGDFFDTFQGNFSPNKVKTEDNFFDSLGVKSNSSTTGSRGSRGNSKERSPPPPVPASLFDSGGDGGWGDWGDTAQASSKQQQQQQSSKPAQSTSGMKLSKKKEPNLFTMTSDPHATTSQTAATSGGWDFDSDWKSFDSPAQPSSKSSSSVLPSGGKAHTPSAEDSGAKQELLQKRREERRLKQQAAREKRAASAIQKPTGLGAVKKD